jgi:hypothetical protein
MEIRHLKKYGNRPEGITPFAFYIGIRRHSSAFIRVLDGHYIKYNSAFERSQGGF